MALDDFLNAVNSDAPAQKDYASGLTLAFDSNPDEEAKKQRLERSTGVPALLMDEPVRKQAELQQFVTSPAVQSLEQSPRTAEWLSNPENAKIAHDDIESLTAIEKLARTGFGKQGGSTLGFGTTTDQQAGKRAKSIGGAFVNALLASPEKVNEGLAGTGEILADFVDWSLAAFPDETGMRKKVADTARESRQFWGKAAEKKMGKFAPQSAESYFSQAGSSIGTSLLAAPFGMGGEGAALGMFGLFADGGYGKMREAGVSMPVAGALSVSNSAMEGLTEKLGLDALYKGSAPVLKKAVQFVMGDLAGEELNTLYSALVDKVTITPDMTMGDVVQQVVDTAIVTSIAGPAQGLGTHSAAKASEKLYGQYQVQQEAKRQSDFLIALGDSVKASKTYARLPEKVQELVKQIKQDGDVQDVYVPVDKFTELFQSQGMDARQAAEQILSDPSRFYEAQATGGDIAIPLEEFARLADAPFYGELAKDARTSLAGMTAREAEAFGQDQEKTVNDLLQTISETVAPVEDAKYQDAYQRIYDDTYGQLIGVNQNPSEAQANATLRAKGLATLAQRYGYDAETLMSQFPISVTRGELPAALQRQPSFTEQQQTAKLAEMIDTLRSGKQVKESEMFGPSLGELLREKGVKDDRGDLAAMDIDKGLKFKKKMLRENGLSLDKARELAVEQKYLPEGATTEDLLDALANEMRGQAKYSPEFTNHQLIDQKQSHDELAQWLDMMGVDLAQTANDKIMEMMQAAVSGDTVLNQPLPEKITIDGVDRWTVNSNGQPLAQTEEGIKNFWKWFGESKVVDADGKPLVVYHGSPDVRGLLNEGFKSLTRDGFFASDSYGTADSYADDRRAFDYQNAEPQTISIYLSLQNPMVVDAAGANWKETEKHLSEAKEKGHDGIIIKNSVDYYNNTSKSKKSTVYSFFDATSAKSAMSGKIVSRIDKTTLIEEASNSGAFDPQNPNILFQAAFHGSPHTFDKFSTGAMGTGEGAQAYGWGLYFAGSKDVAEYYKKTLAEDKTRYEKNGVGVSFDSLRRSIVDEIYSKSEMSKNESVKVGYDIADGIQVGDSLQDFKRFVEKSDWEANVKEAHLIGIKKAEEYKRIEHKGKLYHVELAPSEDEYLLWDKPLSEQSGKVKAALSTIPTEISMTQTGEEFYTGDEMSWATLKARNIDGVEFDKATSEYLHTLGIRGIKYFNGSTRGSAEQIEAGMRIAEKYMKQTENDPTRKEQYENWKRRYEEARQKLDEGYNYVIFSDDDVTITKMEQAQKGVKRAYIKFGDNIPGFEIALLKDADASSFVHELGHYYHEVLGRLATSEGAPEQLKADYDTLLKWLGATDKQSLTVEQSEKFARGFEAYLYEGNAPSQELRGVFQRFKTWLKAVYSSLKSLNVELTDDVRRVFDRLLATDEEIKAAEGEQNVKSIFATAEEAGMSQSVFEAYRKLAEQAHEDAKDRLERAKLKEVKRTHEAWWKEARQKMAEEVEAEAKQEPVYEVLNFLYTGKLFDGSTFEGQSFKFSGSELVKMYDAATVKGMRKRLGDVYRNEGGLSPHVVAEMFGFSSADEMIKKMMEVPKLKEYVKQETDRRMGEQYGAMNTAEIAEEAIKAIHNEEQAKLLREELKAIRRKAKEVKPFVQAEGKAAVDREKAEREYERRWMDAEKKLVVAIERGAKQAEIDDLKESIRADKERARSAKKMAAESIPPIEFFKEAARRHIAGLKVSEILPGKFGRAEAKAGKEAFELNGKAKFAEAAQAKQRQLLNHFLYREATEARQEADKIAAYMRGLEAGKVQQRIGKAGQDYLEQVNALLDKYEFRRQTGVELEARESLLDWMDRYEKAHGYAPPVAPSVMEEAKQVNYRSLTFGELVDVKDTVEAIVYLARTEGKLLQDELKRGIIEVAEEGAASIEANSKGIKPRKPEKSLPQDLPGKYMENYFASHRKMSSLARQMDGGQDGGAIWQMLIRPMNVAGDREAIMRAEAATKLNEIFRVYSGLERTKMHMREFIPEINTSLSKWGRIMVALNMGNEGNRQRLASMYSITEVEAIVSTLDQRDWQFVENIWGMLESYWPEIEAKEKRVNGVAPQKVETMPVVTKFGTIQGGYFPIKYDREETAKTGGQEEAEVYRQMMGGAFTKATTRHGHTEARLEAVNRPLSLSIDTIFQHFNQVIHDLTHHEMLVDVNRLLGTTELQEAIRDNYGMEAYRVFTDGVRDVAVGDIPAQEAWEKFMGYTRVGISTAGLGYNLVTSLMQPLGLTQSMVRIGPQWVGKGIGRWIGSPKRMVETADWIYSKSDFMKTRAMTQNREIAEIANQMTVGVIPNSVRDSFFYLIQQCQKVVDIPTWLGQYEKSMAEHGNEADAVAEADQAVIDSQASGQMKDLARIQRGGPMKKLFTTFYSFFSTTYNLAAESAGRTHFKNPAEVGRFMVDMLMLYTVPVVLTTLLKESIQRAIGGGDDDDEKLLKKLAGEQLGYLSGGFIGFRELGSMFSGFQGYEGPAGARVYSSTIKFFKQLGQGEIDEALIKAGNGLGGILFHYPATQIQRTVDGMKELNDGRGNLLSLLFGKPKKN